MDEFTFLLRNDVLTRPRLAQRILHAVWMEERDSAKPPAIGLWAEAPATPGGTVRPARDRGRYLPRTAAGDPHPFALTVDAIRDGLSRLIGLKELPAMQAAE